MLMLCIGCAEIVQDDLQSKAAKQTGAAICSHAAYAQLGNYSSHDVIEKNGGAKGSRTPDLLNAIAQQADRRL
ncbi:MAG TPA: hypothetical protein DIU09_09195 [Hyphomonadaceae bacterium]|nr:hypothetical protein AEM38_16220 [Hyphomonadaceae bacterium UKL13-1]HCP64751.1 hypothetical protein [Hyphomonadaceae bacterium]